MFADALLAYRDPMQETERPAMNRASIALCGAGLLALAAASCAAKTDLGQACVMTKPVASGETCAQPVSDGVCPISPADVSSTVFKQSLLERAGLAKQPLRLADDEKKRYDVNSNEAGQIKDPNKPV